MNSSSTLIFFHKIASFFLHPHLRKMGCFHLFESKKVAPVERCSYSLPPRMFTFSELAEISENFSPVSFIGNGESGSVYKGSIEITGQNVAVKRFIVDGVQSRKFLVEVLMLNLMHHPNIVRLVGYCSEGDERLLIHEYMSLGSLEDHLHDLQPDTKPLDWSKRMKIAVGIAKALEFLHGSTPPVIYRNFKLSHILLDQDFNPKLSNFGLAKLGPPDIDAHVNTNVIGSAGYCDPEYAMTGALCIKSDVYSFGVILLELITGRKAFDSTKQDDEQNLVAWVKDVQNIPKLADRRLQGRYPARGFFLALSVACMCVQENTASRPHMADIIPAMTSLESQSYEA